MGNLGFLDIVGHTSRTKGPTPTVPSTKLSKKVQTSRIYPKYHKNTKNVYIFIE